VADAGRARLPLPEHDTYSERGGGKKGEQLNNAVSIASQLSPDESPLNPAWVCWLMGLPSGWLELPPIGKKNRKKFRASQSAFPIVSRKFAGAADSRNDWVSNPMGRPITEATRARWKRQLTKHRSTRRPGTKEAHRADVGRSDPPVEVAREAIRAHTAPRTPNHVVLGDPLPGRSALDRLRSEISIAACRRCSWLGPAIKLILAGAHLHCPRCGEHEIDVLRATP
jgi:hypothetical protein